MKEMGIELSNEEVELMMHRADTNGDGKIDYKGEIAAAVFMCHARRHRWLDIDSLPENNKINTHKKKLL